MLHYYFLWLPITYDLSVLLSLSSNQVKLILGSRKLANSGMCSSYLGPVKQWSATTIFYSFSQKPLWTKTFWVTIVSGLLGSGIWRISSYPLNSLTITLGPGRSFKPIKDYTWTPSLRRWFHLRGQPLAILWPWPLSLCISWNQSKPKGE